MILSTLTTIWSQIDSLITPIAKLAFIIGLIYALINWKTLPFAWHIRILKGYTLNHTLNLPPHTNPPSTPQSPTIFLPTIYTTSVSLSEIDYSFHKSNSTYLTDVDIARGYHMYTVCRDGFKRWSAQGRGRLTFMLGGTTCSFKREIRPFAKVEVVTRVVSWDGKWIYLGSWFVEAGFGGNKGVGRKRMEGGSLVVYATCISKIVLKQGRKTVKPEEFFKLCGLIGDLEGGSDWKEINKAIEKRREKGMGLAGHVAALDEGHGWFASEEGGSVLARY